MTFTSVLERDQGPTAERGGLPAANEVALADLYLDRVLDEVIAGRSEYDLMPFFRDLPADPETILYRQDVVEELAGERLRAIVDAFADQMTRVRRYLTLSEHLEFTYSIDGWFLYAVRCYAEAVRALDAALGTVELVSEGLRGLREHVGRYAASSAFAELCAETDRVRGRLFGVRYALTMAEDRIRVSDYGGEPDYTVEIEALFDKFRDASGPPEPLRFRFSPDMNHVEGAISEMVARLNPDVFAELRDYCARHQDFLEPTIVRFDREVQFYLAYLDYASRLRTAGLPFCRPEILTESKEVLARDTFDIALATKLVSEGRDVVLNDFRLAGPERVFVVTGPNQGGKTTFARTFGQLHYFARLGLPVPGSGARLFLFDRLFTHFERAEDPLSERGKLEDDLLRVREIIEQATSRSLVILNEIFTSTSLDDAVLLGSRILRHLIDIDALSVCVTFLDELARLDESVVSVVSSVRPDDATVRTLKVERGPANGLAYAEAIAEKYRVSYRSLTERLAS